MRKAAALLLATVTSSNRRVSLITGFAYKYSSWDLIHGVLYVTAFEDTSSPYPFLTLSEAVEMSLSKRREAKHRD